VTREAYLQVLALARYFDFEQAHSFQDARLARQLFDQTYDLHRLGDEEAELLQYAAILHDIGYWYDYENHHKHAFRMIMEADLTALEAREKAIVANVARYHRSALPTTKHKGFAALSPADQDVVRKLASILRLADGLDRTHNNAVEELMVELWEDTLVIWIYPPTGNEMDRLAGQKKSRFFQEVFGLSVQVLPGR
jgi:exopolyphosphatase/guanosine-5'-triphosphate,3'-diphosphate pyrophosphatase